MRVLLTNDDGIGSDGLLALQGLLTKNHDVRVVAPDKERSGTFHATTFREEIVVRSLGEGRYSCTGTPADCVLYSLLGAIDFKPEVVISGINLGANLGTDIVYSGTVGAARQAVLMKVTGIAVSLVTMKSKPDFTVAARFISDHLRFLTSLWDEEHFINVNVPDEASHKAGISVTRPARRVYNFRIVEEGSEKNERAFTLHGTAGCVQDGDRTDWAAIRTGRISISPVSIHPANHAGTESCYAERVDAFSSGKNAVEFR